MSSLAALPLSSPPRTRHPDDLGDQITDLRRIILHMIEETARTPVTSTSFASSWAGRLASAHADACERAQAVIER